MTDWRERLEKVMEDRGLSMAELALQAKYDYATLWKALKKKQHTMKDSSMRRICDVLEVDPDYIWSGKTNTNNILPVPLLDMEEIEPWFSGGRNRYDSVTVLPCENNSKHTRVFAFKNWLYEIADTISIRDIVYCDPDIEHSNGDYVLAFCKHCYMVRQYIKVADEVYLKPISGGFKTITMGVDDLVLGTIVGYYTPLKELKVIPSK